MAQKMTISIGKNHYLVAFVPKKRMKRMILHYQAGSYWVSYPQNVSLNMVIQWLEGLDPTVWIELRSREKIKQTHDFIYLFGQKYYILLEEEQQTPIVLRKQILYIPTHHEKNHLSLACRSLLECYISRRLDIFVAQGFCSFKPNFSLQHLKACYGKCFFQQRKIKFALALIHEPPTVIDSVIIHELGHFIYPNHSPQFYAWVRARDPHYDQSQLFLKKGGAGDDPVIE